MTAPEAAPAGPMLGERAIVIVLTVAHLDHNPANNDPSNLAALCQRCHLRHDAAQHAASARHTRDRKRGQMTLGLQEGG